MKYFQNFSSQFVETPLCDVCKRIVDMGILRSLKYTTTQLIILILYYEIIYIYLYFEMYFHMQPYYYLTTTGQQPFKHTTDWELLGIYSTIGLLLTDNQIGNHSAILLPDSY